MFQKIKGNKYIRISNRITFDAVLTCQHNIFGQKRLKAYSMYNLQPTHKSFIEK